MIGLDDTTIHLWVWRIDPEAPVPPDCLAPEDLAHADRFLRAEDRAASMASRAGLRAILGEGLGVPPLALEFSAAPLGKPRLVSPPGRVVHFNLSHSHGLAALGVARFEIGVDIEAVRPVEPDLAHAVFSPAELDEFATLDAADRQLAFFLGWTRKEAVVKALGSGLHAPLDRFSVSLTPGAPARLLDMDWAPDDTARWQLETLAIGEGHVGAVAAAHSGWTLAPASAGALSVLGLAAPESRTEIGVTPPLRSVAGG